MKAHEVDMGLFIALKPVGRGRPVIAALVQPSSNELASKLVFEAELHEKIH